MFVHLTNQTEFLVHVRSFIKRTNINELPAERFTNCSLNVWFVYSPTHWLRKVAIGTEGIKHFDFGLKGLKPVKHRDSKCNLPKHKRK
ncbi:hypothetical protein Hanom_Chr16g01482051 [Helianthus anomalus]